MKMAQSFRWCAKRSPHQFVGLLFLGVALNATSALAQSPANANSNAANANSSSSSIDPKKCLDVEQAKASLRTEIMKHVQDAVAEGEKPAMAFELASQNNAANTDAKQVQIRAKRQADDVVAALFGAMDTPATPAAGASSVLNNGDSARRVSMEMFVHCPDKQGRPDQIVQNDHFFTQESSSCSGGATPTDMGMNVTQIYETKMSASKVRDRFARSKLQSGGLDTVTVCLEDSTACGDAGNYGPLPAEFDINHFQPDAKRTYYLQDSTALGTGLKGLFGGSMVNRTALRVSPVSVCGTTVYLTTGFAVSNDLGFDRSSLIGLIAPVGGKTLVIGQVSVQAFDQNSKPVKFLANSHFKETMESILGTNGVYGSIADLIGSTEKPIMGEIGGSSQMSFAASPVPATRPLSQ